ncbi:ATP-dependent zinc metalloprotease FtsH [Zavarzinella formosa]|uniref:ATP-dependent zinc metalloprotease FtsH n=1 Tax=Zavarzinella formosa TaxID=360055 RepID=UPI0002D80959|nr:ATP-dependent zinc metalloprotease FtsH [Zavarzinella formosa]
MEKKRPPLFRYTRRYGIVAAVLIVLVFNLLYVREPHRHAVPYGELKRLIQLPGVEVKSLKVGPHEIQSEIVFNDRTLAVKGLDELPEGVAHLRTNRQGVEQDTTFFPLLNQFVPHFEAEPEKSPVAVAVSWVYATVMFGVAALALVFLVRWYTNNGAGGLGFGRGRHRLYEVTDKTATFKDVAGIDEAKAELQEVVDFLQNPQRYTKFGGRIPKGVLLVGPPGTGKTLLAKSVAGEAGVPFLNMSGSDFVEMFVGVGASRVRDLFREATAKAPCIIFIDELDAMGRSRSGQGFGSHEEREQTLNQLLVEMDGFDSNAGVILMAATNRPEVLDAALLRPGRFDRTVVVDRPDMDGREAIMRVHLTKVKELGHIDLKKIARLTPGCVGADLANIVNEAVLLAARRDADRVDMRDFVEAIERGAVGLERKSRIMRPEEKTRIAVHEAGHALVACAVEHSDPVHKVSIIPRGLAGGYVLQRPDSDRLLMTRLELEARIKVALGGTIAEEVCLHEISTGATSDLNLANNLAAQMVREYGMSRLGRIYLGEAGSAFLPNGAPGEGARACSEQTAREIDLEIRAIISACLFEVRTVLEKGKLSLEAVAKRLIDKEVLEDRELLELLEDNDFAISPAARESLSQHRRLEETGDMIKRLGG